MNSNKTMLVVSKQDLLKAGNQVLFRTLQGYLKDGFSIIFITNQKNDINVADVKELFPDYIRNIQIIRIPVKLPRIKFLKSKSRIKVEKEFFDSKTKYPPPPEESFPFQTEKYGIKHLIAQKYFEYCIYNKAISLTNSYSFDIILAFEVMASNVAKKLSKKLKIPFFVRLEGTFLYHALMDGNAKKLYPLHLRGTKVSADYYIQGNDGTKGLEVLKKLGHSEKKILFVSDGIRKDIYNNNISKKSIYTEFGVRFNKDSKVILTLSKLSHWKRHDRIIGAMPRVLEELPDTWLIIAHRGPMLSSLQRLVNDLNIQNRVIFTGPLPHDSIYRVLNTCDVYVNCNDWSNLSNTVLEALECARPVVSINDGSLDNIIEDGINGLLVDLPNIRKELPDKIIRLLSDNSFRTRISKNARDFSVNNILSWEERMKIEIEKVNNLL